MELDDLYGAVVGALKQASLLPKVIIVKDVENQRLILRSAAATDNFVISSSSNDSLPITRDKEGRPGERGLRRESYGNLVKLDPEEVAFMKSGEDGPPSAVITYGEDMDGNVTGPAAGVDDHAVRLGTENLNCSVRDSDVANKLLDDDVGGEECAKLDFDDDVADSKPFLKFQNNGDEVKNERTLKGKMKTTKKRKTIRKSPRNNNLKVTPDRIPETDNEGKNSTGRYVCYLCPKTFVSEASRNEHARTTHNEDRPYQCHLCDYKSRTKIALNEHHMSHTGERPYKCSCCSFESKTLSHIKKHELKHRGEREFRCKFCDYRANYRYSVQDHERVMHRNPGALFHCTICNFKTIQEKRRLAHIQAHDKNIFQECHVCHKKIYDKIDFNRHVRKHDAKPRMKNIPCSLCDLKFYNNEYLRIHMFLHTGKKEYRCRLCGSEFRAYKSMIKHFGKHHPDEKAYHCSACDFYSNNLRESNRHPSTLTHMDNVRRISEAPS